MTEVLPDLGQFVSEYGSIGLLLGSFLAGTILPFSSEAMLLAALQSGLDVRDALLYASIGNCLACLLNYGLGVFLDVRMHDKLENTRIGRKALSWMKSHGMWSLLGSWLPVIGDPLTIVAGLSRVPLWLFILVVCPLRVLRYLGIIFLNFNL